MDDKFLIEARRRAEEAVHDMREGELKVKAFEVILKELISGAAITRSAGNPVRGARKTMASVPGVAKSLSERLLVLQSEGFFDTPTTIGAVREGLQSHGWHYPVTTLSGALQSLVQKRKLRRERVKDNKKMIWKYFNP